MLSWDYRTSWKLQRFLVTTAKTLQLFPVERVPRPWWDTAQQGAAGLYATQGQKNLTAWSDFQDCPESGIKELVSHMTLSKS